MKICGLLALCCALVLSAAGAAAAARGVGTAPPIAWGAADDAPKFADDGGVWFYDELHDANLTQNRWTVGYVGNDPTTIEELPFLERAAPQAEAAGARIILVLYSRKGFDHDRTKFCAWARHVVQTGGQ